jgi:hypothetical protein
VVRGGAVVEWGVVMTKGDIIAKFQSATDLLKSTVYAVKAQLAKGHTPDAAVELHKQADALEELNLGLSGVYGVLIVNSMTHTPPSIVYALL